ncbi:MAG: 4Fe-4S dicluster domain-containing protein, partial [Gammaproteobacteria bacterium]|nr:4Fe-4S dicluster domain-containing protein [Gammaproteobacteria bacterium]
EQLLIDAKFTAQAKQKVIIGGPMMGFSLHQINAPILKATNCIIVASDAELPDAPAEQNCIRCGDCEQVCPADLLPAQLVWYAKDQDHQKLKDHDLFDCIECGACAYVCPSSIPLVQYYRIAKSDIRKNEQEQRQADRAKERFELRNQRLERDKLERLERSKKAAEARQKSMSANSDGDVVAAALARIKAKKAAANSGDIQEVNPQDRVAAAIARAKAKKAQQAENQLTSSTDAESPAASDVDPQKARVAAAIARAKAKKAQQAESPASDVDPQKARVAAAIARAKAKRAQQQQVNDQPVVNTDSESPAQEVDPQKARVAAAIARAKAKRAASKIESNDNNDQT